NLSPNPIPRNRLIKPPASNYVLSNPPRSLSRPDRLRRRRQVFSPYRRLPIRSPEMALQNIGASNKDDAFYRYKMPRMRTKIEGRGNGIKTKIENMADIAKALARPASNITNYFKHELGTGSEFDEKTGASVVYGAHGTAKLAGLLDVFIQKYVQCYGCRNPETEILISRSHVVSLKCAACGFVSDVGMKDKIIKNQPDNKKGGKDKKLRRAEKERLKEGVAADGEQQKLKKDAKKRDGSSKGSTEDQLYGVVGGDANESDDNDDVEWQTDTSLEAAKQRMQEQLSTATAGMVMLSVDESEKKKKKKQAPPQDVTTNPCDELVEQIKATLGNVATTDQLKGVLSSSTLPSQDVMNSLFEALFDGFKEEVVKNMEYITAAVPDEGYQALLLQAIEAFGGKCSIEALKEIPFVLEALYHGDVLEEESIVQWYNVAVAGGKNSQVLKVAKPFMEWLQSAD
ncbi:hypothetical protein EJB05_01650, partial [Eragrostis curvula]